jgi:prephenate dehydratase
MRVGYQGEPGAFSEEAVRLLLPRAEPVPVPTFRGVFEGVESRELDGGVVPLENSQAGSINETYDLLARGGVWIVGEVVVRVDHALLALPGTRLEDVRTVVSHPQALAQCDEFLTDLGAEIIPVHDTAGAARLIAEQGRRGEAAVASRKAATIYGLDVLAEDIQTHRDNRTRFAAIATDPAPLGRANKTSILFELANEPGSLYRFLGHFSGQGLNLSKLESRPVGATPWQYRFYLDVDAGLEDERLGDAIEASAGAVSLIKVLGSYPAWREGD